MKSSVTLLFSELLITLNDSVLICVVWISSVMSLCKWGLRPLKDSADLCPEKRLCGCHTYSVCVGVCLCVSCTFRWSGLLLLWGCHSGFLRWKMMCFCSSDSVMELSRPTLTPLLCDLKLRPRCVCVCVCAWSEVLFWISPLFHPPALEIYSVWPLLSRFWPVSCAVKPKFNVKS